MEEDDSDLFDPPRRITFSFDSSGWLYTYHLGVAHYLQQALLGGSGGGGPSSDFAFSGSSGGALVAGALATGIDIHALASFVISCHGECQYNPWRMFPCTDRALQRFVGQAAHKRANGRLRVLLTRIQLWTLKPAVRPETVSAFGSTQHLKQVLRASCHIPFLAGPLPYHVPRQDAPDGSMLHAGGDFIDGLYWPSVLFMWRQFDRADTLVRVSGIGNPLAAIRPPLPVPLHWVVLPPPPETLWKLFACGYHDAAQWLADHTEEGEAELLAEEETPPSPGSHSGLPGLRRRSSRQPLPQLGAAAAHGLPAGALPPPLAPSREEMRWLLLRGWAHLLLLTLLFPLAVPYIAFLETKRRKTESDERPLRDVVFYRALHSLQAAAFFALWPVLLGATLLRYFFCLSRQPDRRRQTYFDGSSSSLSSLVDESGSLRASFQRTPSGEYQRSGARGASPRAEPAPRMSTRGEAAKAANRL